MGWQKNTSKSVRQKVLTAVVKNEMPVASILKVEGKTI